MMRRLLPLLVVTALGIPAPSAHACFLPAVGRPLYPQDHALHVPPGVQILVLVPPNKMPVLTLQEDNGDLVRFTATLLPSGKSVLEEEAILRMVPDKELPEGRYIVSNALDAGGTSWEFTVGLDAATPLLDRPVVTSSYAQYLDGIPQDTCGSVPRAQYALELPVLPGALTYQLFEDDQLQAARVPGSISLEVPYLGNIPVRCFLVVATNEVGARSPPSLPVCLGGDPPHLAVDAGLAPDAAVGPAPTPQPTPTPATNTFPSGCVATPNLGAWGLLLLLSLRRRHQTQRAGMRSTLKT